MAAWAPVGSHFPPNRGLFPFYVRRPQGFMHYQRIGVGSSCLRGGQMKLYDNAPTDDDVFLAPLQGRLVECISIEDAVTIKTANGIIDNTEGRRFSPF